jgi:hypothetical protein
MKMRPQRTFESIVRVLDDGAWHTVVDLQDVTSYPSEWVDELRAEGVLDVDEGVVRMVRLSPERELAPR